MSATATTMRPTVLALALGCAVVLAACAVDDSAAAGGTDAVSDARPDAALDVASDGRSDPAPSDVAADADGTADPDVTADLEDAEATELPAPPPETCNVPLELVDTSNPDRRVGDGAPGSCTRDALAEAVASGGVITLDCGAEPVTIAIDETVVLPADKDTVLDGEGRVILAAGARFARG